MTNLYAEWKKLKNNAESTSARLYRTKNENTEREFEEAVETLVNFEKDNGIPLMADESEVKKMFCPMTNEEWFCGLMTEEKARFLDKICYSAWGDINSRFKDMADYTDWIEWLKEIHK